MTIGFSTHWPKSMGPEYAGKPNFFPEKVWQSFPDEFTADVFTEYLLGMDAVGEYDFHIDANLMQPKLHTLRQDPQDRWKVGMKIHPVINNRTRDRFQFAPVLEVKGIQRIVITHSVSNPGIARMRIDGKVFYEGPTWSCYKRHLEDFIRADGFESVEQFFAWFNKDFEGKIIHWTDLKY